MRHEGPLQCSICQENIHSFVEMSSTCQAESRDAPGTFSSPHITHLNCALLNMSAQEQRNLPTGCAVCREVITRSDLLRRPLEFLQSFLKNTRQITNLNAELARLRIAPITSPADQELVRNLKQTIDDKIQAGLPTSFSPDAETTLRAIHFIFENAIKAQQVPEIASRAIKEKNDLLFNLLGVNPTTELQKLIKSSNLSVDLLDYLINKGADKAVLNHPTESRFTPVQLAVIHGNHTLLQFLLENGVQLNSFPEQAIDSHPLYLAAMASGDNPDYPYLQVVEVLSAHGALFNPLVANASHPLHQAISAANKEAVTKMIEAMQHIEFDIKLLNTRDKNPLYLAASCVVTASHDEELDRAKCEEVLNILVESEFNLGSNSSLLKNSLHNSILEKREDVAEVLIRKMIEKEVDLTTSNNPLPPIHMATLHGLKKTITLLVENGVDVNSVSLTGYTPLFYAASKSKELVQHLIDHGAQFNSQDLVGNTALHNLIHEKKLKAVQYLVAAMNTNQANFNIPNYAGETAMHLAVKLGNIFLINLLARSGASMDISTPNYDSPIYSAVKQGKIDVVRILYQNGAQLNSLDSFGSPLIHTAVRDRNIEMIKFLIEEGVDLSLVDGNRDIVLHLAAANNHIEITQTLVEAMKASGMSLDLVDNVVLPFKKPAIQRAVDAGHHEVVSILAKNGASLDIQDMDNGDSLLHIAAKNGDEPTIRALMKAGAKLNLKNNDGKLAIDVAQTAKVKETLNLSRREKALKSCLVVGLSVAAAFMAYYLQSVQENAEQN